MFVGAAGVTAGACFAGVAVGACFAGGAADSVCLVAFAGAEDAFAGDGAARLAEALSTHRTTSVVSCFSSRQNASSGSDVAGAASAKTDAAPYLATCFLRYCFSSQRTGLSSWLG